MCVGGSSAPPPPPPPEKPQEVQQPETIQAVRDKRKNADAGGMGGGTLLTGPSGVQTGALNVTKPTLLGQ